MSQEARRYAVATAWCLAVVTALYLYLFRRDLVLHQLDSVLALPIGVAATIYLVAGAARAFTLIPSTYLVLAGLPFFPPWLLLILTLIGILISSAIIYWFAESLHVHQLLQGRKYRRQYDRVHDLMQRHELPIIIGWSFFPLVPTDVICYVSGVLEVNFPKFLLGVAVGEGAICAIYIFLGTQALRWAFP